MSVYLRLMGMVKPPLTIEMTREYLELTLAKEMSK